jgi:hypothetical protein
MVDIPLTAEQGAEAKRLSELFQQTFLQEADRLARLFASKATHQMLGKTEFELRDFVHHLGTQFLQTALDERKKGGTKVRA